MPNYTFGFEAEYQRNVAPLAQRLAQLNLTIDHHIHNYTCDCEGCMVSIYDEDAGTIYDSLDIYPLRVKADSSCDGEVISKVYSSPDDSEVMSLWSQLEETALSVDAEPGFSSGFHVHVGRNHHDAYNRGLLVLAMASWEDALLKLAAGRWTRNRNWNMSLNTLLSYSFDRIIDQYDIDETPGFDASAMVLDWVRKNSEDANDICVEVAYDHTNIDRHSSMAWSPRHPTLEFRLWNSTRVAWRMELWCRMSLLLADPDFVSVLIDNWTPDVSFLDLPRCVSDYFRVSGDAGRNAHTRTLDLLERQVNYLDSNPRIEMSTPFIVV